MTGATGLARFVDAQAGVYAHAFAEIRRGAKRTHWMWFIFPQLAGLGQSPTARFFGIILADEAASFFAHPLLGSRYCECVEALQALLRPGAVAVFGPVDALKLRSSLTLFEAVSGEPSLAWALDRWFDGVRDQVTLRLLSGFADDGDAA